MDSVPRTAQVTLRYGDVELAVKPGTRLLDALLENGIDHRHICGGRGFCTSCRVEVRGAGTGLTLVNGLEHERLGSEAGRLRLACQAVVIGDASVTVAPPLSSRFSPFDDE